jgi:hypothetical protein
VWIDKLKQWFFTPRETQLGAILLTDLTIGPGDSLIMVTEQALTAQQVETLKGQLESFFTENKKVLIVNGMQATFTVLRKTPDADR